MDALLEDFLKGLWQYLLRPRGIIYFKATCVTALAGGSILDWIPTIRVRWMEKSIDVIPSASTGTFAVLAGMVVLLVAMNILSTIQDRRHAGGLQSLLLRRQQAGEINIVAVIEYDDTNKSPDENMRLAHDLVVGRPLRLKMSVKQQGK